jgi:hypothetical protein
MFEQCETCKNLDPNNNVYGEAWMSGPVFEHHYIKLPDIIDHDQRGCSYCSLLANLVNDFVPNWKSKTERVSLHVTAPVRRPIQVRINEAPEPDVDLNELSAVVLSATEGMVILFDSPLSHTAYYSSSFIANQWSQKFGGGKA